MALDADLVGEMLVQITLGTAKQDFGRPLDGAASALWDEMAAEVAAIHEAGGQVEPTTPDLPEWPPWVQETPTPPPQAPPGEAVAGGQTPATRAGMLPVAGSQEAPVPWTVSPDRQECPSGYAVVNQDTGKVVPGGCHSSEADAVKHQRALYRNVEEAGMSTTQAEQAAARRPPAERTPPGLRKCPPGMEPNDQGDCVPAGQATTHGAEALVSEQSWDGSPARFTDQQYRAASAVCEGDAPPKQACHLPHHEPGGQVSRAGVHAAAAGRGVSRLKGVSADGISSAKTHLRGHYTRDLKEEPPDSLAAGTELKVWAQGDDVAAYEQAFGGKPNPATPPDRRLQENRKKRRTRASAAGKVEATGDGAWEGILVIEGIPTGDGREFAPDSLTWPDTVQLTYQPPTHGGAPGAGVDIGVIDEVWRDDANPRIIRGRGRMDMGDPVAADVYRKIGEGFLKGMSVDVDDIDPFTDVELVWPDLGEETDELGGFEQLLLPPQKRIFHKGRIRGAAVLSMPAFVDAQLWVDGADPPTLPDLTALEEAARADDGEDLGEEDAMVAAGNLDGYRPPGAWFEDPGLGQRCPIVVTSEGRVYGHAAQWGDCHIGFGTDRCVTVPREADFPYFTQGSVLTAEGEQVPVGQITVGTGHAPKAGLSWRRAQEHYDHTGSVVADVAVGADRIGIWVAGAVRPNATAGQIHALRASGQVSGDWRWIGGRLRLVALLGVNVPGFPVPRPEARVAGGEVVALTAAGMVDLGPRVDVEAELDQRALQLLLRRTLDPVLNGDEQGKGGGP